MADITATRLTGSTATVGEDAFLYAPDGMLFHPGSVSVISPLVVSGSGFFKVTGMVNNTSITIGTQGTAVPVGTAVSGTLHWARF